MHNGGDVADLTAWARSENARQRAERSCAVEAPEERITWEQLDSLPRAWTWDAAARRWVPPAK